MQDTLASMEDFDLELDNMELVAAAAGYYYYNSITRQPRHGSSPYGSSFMSEVLDGPDDGCREMFRMDKHVFHNLCGILRQRGMLRDTAGVMIEEQLAIFLNIIVFRWTTFSQQFYPYFKDCIGVIDAMHVPAHLSAKDQSRFRNKKGVLSQNVLAACTFDLQFIFIYPGWEGSAADSRVLRAVLDDPDQNFPIIPEGKYYIVDTGYSNLEGFIAPYPGVRYHLHEFRGANQLPRNPQELFNHRHSSLRNTIQVSFDVLKTRFPILNVAPQYGFHVQRDIVIAACVLHNYIRREGKDDWLFANVDGAAVAELPDIDDESGIQLASSIQDHMAFSLRESIMGAMWNDFINKWDQW
ncbi:PREDICTED: uncharacterized protein LOC105107491 [Populus euphratica]|uniref:Uncharacterized protein LOC105107491 n=1 Tax=Populus euphratica TaxID=75702 RepID=A0AAJ6WZ29_POPEU|nr:PREDICTED: uncharacterized protein LOC105107491 [Populus euphratica]